MSGHEHQLSVAGKIKKHFNTGPRPSSTAAGVSVITVSKVGSADHSTVFHGRILISVSFLFYSSAA